MNYNPVELNRIINNSLGFYTKQEAMLRQQKDEISRNFENSIGYQPLAKRNKEWQGFIVTSTKDDRVKNIIARPDEPLKLGDIIECYDANWLVVSVDVNQQLFPTGVMKLCTHLFSFQNFDSTIITQWGVFEKGGSATIDSDKVFDIPSTQMRVYLPYSDDTRKFYKGKRLMVDTIYTKDGEIVGDCYKVSSIRTSEIQGSKIIELTVEECAFDALKDNVQLLICDYITNTSTSVKAAPKESKLCNIKHIGSPSVRIGGSAKRFEGIFYDTNGLLDDTISAIWSIEVPNGLKDFFTLTSNNDNSCTIKVSGKYDLEGQIVTLYLTDVNGVYSSSLQLNVVASLL